MKFSALLGKVNFILANEVGTSQAYADEVVLGFLAEAETVIVGQVSGANPSSVSVASAAGTRQQIPADGVRLLSVDTVGGRGVRLVERGAKDEVDPYWRNAAAGTHAVEYILDDRMPKSFDVSPPLQAGVSIALSYDKLPPEYDFTATPDPDVTLGRVHEAAMVDFAVYRCLSRADENTPEFGKAGAHYQTFIQKIGGKTEADAVQSPKQGRFLR
ncbi:MAG: hypothetical protein HPY82_05720 [Gammaproteobacteria bacterium]|nr:hypothetical protein [Gammaproteobacteria bacterium]